MQREFDNHPLITFLTEQGYRSLKNENGHTREMVKPVSLNHKLYPRFHCKIPLGQDSCLVIEGLDIHLDLRPHRSFIFSTLSLELARLRDELLKTQSTDEQSRQRLFSRLNHLLLFGNAEYLRGQYQASGLSQAEKFAKLPSPLKH